MNYNSRDNDGSSHLSKKFRFDPSQDESKDNDVKHAIISKNLHKEDDDNVSVITDISEPKESATLTTTGIRDNNVLGTLLNTLFPVKKAKKSIVRIKKLSHVSDYNATSLKIHPCLTPEQKPSGPQDVSYRHIVDTFHYVASFLSHQDVLGAEAALNEIFIENCLMKTAALSRPTIGRHRLIELFRSVVRSSKSLKMVLTNVIDNTEILGTPAITIQHVSECMSIINKYSFKACRNDFVKYIVIFTGRDSSDELWNDICK